MLIRFRRKDWGRNPFDCAQNAIFKTKKTIVEFYFNSRRVKGAKYRWYQKKNFKDIWKIAFCCLQMVFISGGKNFRRVRISFQRKIWSIMQNIWWFHVFSDTIERNRLYNLLNWRAKRLIFGYKTVRNANECFMKNAEKWLTSEVRDSANRTLLWGQRLVKDTVVDYVILLQYHHFLFPHNITFIVK